jgi:sterol desaturase/sphingolipid hydroxylase (fatty acid hydroxylase superfamily)
MVHPGLFLLLVLLTIFVRALLWTALEHRYPAYEVRYREVLGGDIAAFLIAVAIYATAQGVDNWLSINPTMPPSVMRLPVIVRVLLYLVIADFGHYWVHRLIHLPGLWRIHKWHHSPTYMYWFAGLRASLPQQVLINIPYILAGSLLDFSWPWLGLLILTKNNVQNDWMHLNVPWGNRWLEWFIITPRYHHVHHSDKPEHYVANLAPLFPLWDHLFGTHVDPETLTERPRFGIGERLPVARLALGV